jgi:Fe2+ transport system protein B
MPVLLALGFGQVFKFNSHIHRAGSSVAPSFSTFSAIAEILVTIGVLYVVFRNYTGRGFPWQLATGVIVFEFSVNMMYMIFRMRETSASLEPSPYAPFMAIHGSLSLLVFILLAVFCYLAFNAIKRDRYFFREHPAITWSFVVLWLLSVGSGEVLYYLNYLA